MKQTHTIENDLLMYLRYLQNTQYEKEEVVSSPHQLIDMASPGTDQSFLPRQEVIDRIIGYAKALEVLKTNKEEPLFITKN